MVNTRAKRQSESLLVTYEDFINLDRHPINGPDPELESSLVDLRAALAEDGCAVLENFLTQAAIEALTIEADTVADHGHRSFNRTNVDLTKDEPCLPEADPLVQNHICPLRLSPIKVVATSNTKKRRPVRTAPLISSYQLTEMRLFYPLTIGQN